MPFPRVLCVALMFALCAGAQRAAANPDVWVTTGMTFHIQGTRVSGLSYWWQFDGYYSSRAIGTYDDDRDGTLSPAEVSRLRAESFDPLGRFDYFVHLLADDKKIADLSLQSFAASIEEKRLVYRFSLALPAAVTALDAPVVASLFDMRNIMDFRFRDKDFLLVEGVPAASCKFRLARGAGTLADHPQTVTLRCGG